MLTTPKAPGHPEYLIPSHIGISNEKAYELSKKGTRLQITQLKPYICWKIKETKKAFQMENTKENMANARVKSWEKIYELYTKVYKG